MRKFKLQPQELADMTLPYPYFITEDKMVGRQDFWKGKPFKLLGFNKTPKAGDISLLFDQTLTLEKLQEGAGMYPVFENKDGGWVTLTNPIESVTEIK